VNSSEAIEATVLSDTLKSLPSIQSLVTWQGQQKIFWEHVDDIVPNPYIVLKHYLGGDERDNNYSDSWWIIYGHTASISQARLFGNAISELKGMMPVTTAYQDVCAYTKLKKTAPYFYRYQVENVPFFRSGAIIRLQLYLGSTI
jgi:hypothetical protein